MNHSFPRLAVFVILAAFTLAGCVVILGPDGGVLTVSVALLLVTLPDPFVTTTR